jgi:hypothetical protein
MINKYFLSLLIFLFLLGACDKLKPSEEKPDVEESITNVPADTVQNEMTIDIPDTELGFLVTYENKYVTREKLFENEVLETRLKKLDRFNYDALLQFWNTETPIVIIDNIVHMSGCKQHDCPSNAYDFFIDVNSDNINIYHFRNNMLRVYQEKGLIALPEAFAQEMEIKKSNARIGEVEDTESSYSLTNGQ